MKAYVMSIGDELVSGQVPDSNSSWISRMLLENKGIGVSEIRICSDKEDDIARAVDELSSKGDILFITGGMGPTPDDRTRQAIARCAGKRLFKPEGAEADLRKAIEKRGIPWRESMALQVMVPEGFDPIPNPTGQALGMEGRIGRCRVFVLPGVPSEMKAMFRSEVLERISEGHEVSLEYVTAVGEPEAGIGEKLSDLMQEDDPSIGITIYKGAIAISILSRGKHSKEKTWRMKAEIRRRRGSSYVGTGRLSLAGAVVKSLKKRGMTLAVAESCTGGMLASELVSVPGVSRVFLGGFVAYSNEAKTAWLGVKRKDIREKGAVSKEVAEALAKGAATEARADLGVGITGIAGPRGGTRRKPAGTVHMAWFFKGETIHELLHFKGSRQDVREKAARRALLGIWSILNGSKHII